MVIDGVDQYDMIFNNGSSARTEIMLQLDPASEYFGQVFIGQAAIRLNNGSDAWKLIMGQPNCTKSTNWTEPFTVGDACPSGWVQLNGSEVCVF